jgi:acetyl-CoA carboxylase biotin carboxyl carrier protein
MEIEELERLIRLLKGENLTEITVWEGEKGITLRQDALRQGGEGAPKAASERAPEDADSFLVTAPLVGTFHRRPSPEEAPFVDEGREIKPGETLCIIEAMKVMNEIQAERAGRLERILVEDGAAVEYGQALFRFLKP